MIKDRLPVKLGATREVEREFLAELRGEKPTAERYLIASRLDGSDTFDPHGLAWFDDPIEAASVMISLSLQHPPLEFALFKCNNVLIK